MYGLWTNFVVNYLQTKRSLWQSLAVHPINQCRTQLNFMLDMYGISRQPNHQTGGPGQAAEAVFSRSITSSRTTSLYQPNMAARVKHTWGGNTQVRVVNSTERRLPASQDVAPTKQVMNADAQAGRAAPEIERGRKLLQGGSTARLKCQPDPWLLRSLIPFPSPHS